MKTKKIFLCNLIKIQNNFIYTLNNIKKVLLPMNPVDKTAKIAK